jgi:PAS domain S-box-containing protein
MHAKAEDITEEVRRLRSCINDLLSLLALPAMWSGRRPSQIIETLSDVLLGMLRLDFSYARLNDPAGGSPIEVVRTAQRRGNHLPQEIGQALGGWLTDYASDSPMIAPNPFGEGEVNIVRSPFGLKQETGLVVVGSRRADFPTETESLLLKVAANQTAIAVENARLFELAQHERAGAEEAREQVSNILESITDSFAVYDREWRIIYLNKEAEKSLPRLGLTREKVLGKKLWELLPDLTDSVVYEQYHRAVAEQVPVEFEIFYPPFGGWYEMRAYPSKDGLAVYSQEITERKRVEEISSHLAAIVESSDDAIISKSLEGTILSWNKGAMRIFGYSAEEIIGKSIYILIPPDRTDEEPRIIERLRRGESIESYETVRVAKDGRMVNISLTVSPIKDKSGKVIAASKIARDITERKQMEREREQLLAREQAARAEAERRWRESQLLAAATRQLSASLKLQDLLSTICRAAREIADADGATFVLREGDQVYYAEEDASEPLWKGRRFPITACVSGWAILEHKPAIVEDIYTDQRLPIEAYQSTFVKSLVMVPVRSHSPLGAIGIYWAQTQKASEHEVALLEALADAAHISLINAQLYEQTKAAREQAEQANRLKDEFLATVSHELRAPLNAILGWTRMLRTGNLDEQTYGRAFETIERNAKSQAQLVEDLLDVSRIISGKMRLDVQSVEMAPVIQATIDSVRPAADAKSIRLNATLDPRAGPVSGDPTRLQQIVWNLLSNAIKFTPKGGQVQVRLERINSHIELTVSDTGIGISPDFLPYVFDRFRQADSTLTRHQPGLGLGLAIVRHLVELHGGSIHPYSAGEGQGATFAVKFPLMILRDAEHLPPEPSDRKHPTDWPDLPFECPPALNGLRVLVVDDEPDARQLLTVILERCKAEVITVPSAADALDALERLGLDIVISDIEMPGEDGYSFIRKVRAKEESQKGRIAAAALTAHAGVADRMRALSAGFDMHVPKPVEPAELVAVIASLAGRIGKGSAS